MMQKSEFCSEELFWVRTIKFVAHRLRHRTISWTLIFVFAMPLSLVGFFHAPKTYSIFVIKTCITVNTFGECFSELLETDRVLCRPECFKE